MGVGCYLAFAYHHYERLAGPVTILSADIENSSLMNQSEHLSLRSLSEPKDNSLLLVAEEAVVNRSGTIPARVSESLPSELLKGAFPIESTACCKTFELYWKHYVAYLVTEECVGGCGQYSDEVYTGKLLRHYTKSHFLDHLNRDTGGHFKPIQHFKLVCLNHLVDVASEEPPEIRVVGFDESKPHRSVQ